VFRANSYAVLGDQARSITLTNEFEMRDAVVLLWGGLSESSSRDATYRFVAKHFDELATRMLPRWRAGLVWVLAGVCDVSKKPEIETFEQRIESYEGGPRAYREALESLELCEAKKRALTPAIEQFLKTQ